MSEIDDEIERVRRVHGDEAAEVAARFIAAPSTRGAERDVRKGWRVGVRQRNWSGIAKSTGHEPGWREREFAPRGLPRSGAPNPPKPRLKRAAGADDATHETRGKA